MIFRSGTSLYFFSLITGYTNNIKYFVHTSDALLKDAKQPCNCLIFPIDSGDIDSGDTLHNYFKLKFRALSSLLSNFIEFVTFD